MTIGKLLNFSESQFPWTNPSVQGSVLQAQGSRTVLVQKGPKSLLFIQGYGGCCGRRLVFLALALLVVVALWALILSVLLSKGE